jgi:hypothetical protein
MLFIEDLLKTISMVQSKPLKRIFPATWLSVGDVIKLNERGPRMTVKKIDIDGNKVSLQLLQEVTLNTDGEYLIIPVACKNY